MLQFEFRNSVRVLNQMCDVYGLEKGFQVTSEILHDEERWCKDRFTRIAETGFPHQENARLYASLVLFYLCRDLRELIQENEDFVGIGIFRRIIKDISKLL